MGNNKQRPLLNILLLIIVLCFFMMHATPPVYAQFLPFDPALGGFGFGGFGAPFFGSVPSQGFFGPQQGAGFYGPQQGAGFFTPQQGIPFQGTGFNPGYAPYGSGFPYVPVSSDNSDSSSSDTRTYQSYNQGFNPGYTMGYNPGYLPGSIPTNGAFGPAAGMYGMQAGFQPFGQPAGFAPFGQPAGFAPFGQAAGFAPFGQAAGFAPFGQAAGFAPFGQAAGMINPFMNGLANPFAAAMGPFMQPGFQAVPNSAMGFNPWGMNQGFNPWGMNPYQQGINPYNPYNPYGNYSDNDDDDDDDDDNGTVVTDDIPDIRGYWSGSWKILETETDPNGKSVLVEKDGGDILFHITSQIQTGGSLSGTVEITGWNVEDPNFTDWVGESDEVKLTGWVDKYNRWLFVHYFNFTGDTLLSDLSNLICDYTWTFDNMNIKDTGFSGSLRIRGTNNYDVVGTFNVGTYQP